jgi:hypothetical protein
MVTLPADGQNLIVWSAQHGRQAIELLNALVLMEIHLVPPSGANALGPGRHPILGDEGGLVLPLPLRFVAPIADPASYTGTAGAAYSQAILQALMDQVSSLTRTVAALQAQLRLTGQLPS